MADDRASRPPKVADLVERLRASDAAAVSYADQVFIGAELLGALTSSARALALLDEPCANRVVVADQIGRAIESLERAAAALRAPVRSPNH